MFPATLATRYPKTVILAHLLVGAVAAVGLARLRSTDEVLDFLPPTDPDVKVFNEVNARFGSLRVALIGVVAPDGEDVFSPVALERLTRATEELKTVRGVDRVVSLTSLVDFVPSDAAVQIQPLIDHPPKTDAERAALRAKVMSRDIVVGNFVSRDARAALILAFLSPPVKSADGKMVLGGGSLREVALALRDVALREFKGQKTIFGGAPFAAATVFDETQGDIRLLTPIALIFMFAFILVSFRDLVGVVLTVFTVAWGVVVTLGAMGFAGEPYTVVSSTLPVIIFASGSSYAVHLLGRYYTLGGKGAGPTTILEAAKIVVPPVTIAGLTTSSGFFSFLVMDIPPMRAFGLECAVGVLLTFVSAMTLVPAVLHLWPRPASHVGDAGRVKGMLSEVGLWSARRRLPLLIVAGVTALFTIGPMLKVKVRMDAQAFFREGSEPWQAERFLDDWFGGSQFLQVAVHGDLGDPSTLREIKRLEQFARTLPGVSQVQSVVATVELVSDAMGGGKRLPETPEQARNLYFFLEGDPSVRTLMSPERDAALLQIRIRGDANAAVAGMEKYLQTALPKRPTPPTAASVAERIAWIAAAHKVVLPPDVARQVVEAVKPLPAGDPDLVARRRQAALEMLAGKGGAIAAIEPADLREKIATAVAPGMDDASPARTDLVAASPSPEEGELAWKALADHLGDAGRRLVVGRAMEKAKARLDGPPLAQIEDALLDLLPLRPMAAAPRDVSGQVTGEPVLERGLSNSVGKNQERSLIVSLAAVLVFMFLLFRSVRVALLSVIPAVLTLAITFGAMGLMGMQIDIGTSLVASICTGAGSDFAMHYLWYLKRLKHDEVVRFVGPIMVISALLVACCFAVLGLGRSQPMRMFGLLAAITMALASLLTFVLVPALIGKGTREATTGENR